MATLKERIAEIVMLYANEAIDKGQVHEYDGGTVALKILQAVAEFVPSEDKPEDDGEDRELYEVCVYGNTSVSYVGNLWLTQEERLEEDDTDLLPRLKELGCMGIDENDLDVSGVDVMVPQ